MLIPDWRLAGRWWSVRVSALGSILYAGALAFPEHLLTLWNMMPGEVRGRVPAHVGTWVGFLLFVAVIVARVIPQRGASDGR